MNIPKNIKKISFFAFIFLLAMTAIAIIFSSQLQEFSHQVKTVSEPGLMPGVFYEIPVNPDPNKPRPAPVYPKAQSDVNLKVRKSLVDLSREEKAAFVNALKKVKNTFPEGSKLSIFDQLVLEHVLVGGFEPPFAASGPSAGFNPAHPGHPGFLPWHRKLVYDLEKELQKIDPNITIPYWDWTDPNALDVMLSDDFMGGNGEGTIVEVPGFGKFEGGVVKSGPFADWTLNEDIHIEGVNFTSFGPKLLRFLEVPPFDEYPIPKEVIDRVMNLDNYEIFSGVLEGGGIGLNEKSELVPDWAVHVYSHAMIGGVLLKDYSIPAFPTNQVQNLGTNMSILSSPYDPIFWLIHSNVDRLWAEWQDRGHTGADFYPSEGKDFGYNLNDPIWPWDGGLSKPGNLNDTDLVSMLPVIDEVVSAADLLDFRKLGYTYDSTRLRSVKPLLDS